MGERQKRRARNESLFREVNERIEEIARDFGATGETEFICECDRLDCTQRFDMSLGEYERLRADPTTFAVVPGHQSPDVDYVVSERGNYYIVRKRAGEPARVAVEDSAR